MRTVTLFGGVTGLILVAVTALAVEPAGNVGVVSIGPVAEQVLTPRVRVSNDLQEPIAVFVQTGATGEELLATVPGFSTQTYPLVPGDEIRLLVRGTSTGLDATAAASIVVGERTDAALMVAGTSDSLTVDMNDDAWQGNHTDATDEAAVPPFAN